MAINTRPTFSINGLGDGIVSTNINSWDSSSALTIQADGKILVVGDTLASLGEDNDIALIRYNSDGSLDNTFNGNGIITTDINSPFDFGSGVSVQTDGKILVVGSSGDYGLSDIALIRYNKNGSVDSTFGAGDGIVTTDISMSDDGGSSVAIQADGKILVAGSTSLDMGMSDIALVRYNKDGSLDTTFGSKNGIVTTDIRGDADSGRVVSVLSDGKILIAGFDLGFTDGNSKFVLVRYNSNGTIDTTFNSNGIATTDINLWLREGFIGGSITPQTDGKFLVSYFGTSEFSLVRFNNNGSLDTTFANGGIVTTNVVSQNFWGPPVVTMLTDGTILVTGTSGEIFSESDFTLLRLNSDGSLDTSFDTISSLNGQTQFTEKSTPAILDTNATLFDAELAASGNYAGSTLTLARHNAADSDDLFSGAGIVAGKASGSVITSNITIGSYSYNSGTLVITFNNAATQTLVNQAISKIAYSNSNELPDASVQIDWTFSDGNTGSQGTGGALSTSGVTFIDIITDEDELYGGIGNGKDNIYYDEEGNGYYDGGTGNDHIIAWFGDDTLDGGSGNDTMYGEDGKDTYLVDSIGDVVREAGTFQGEIDIVKSSISYTLVQNVENLTLTGINSLNATGNSLNNKLTGNTAANVLNGSSGNDIMIGGTGNDIYIVDRIGDVVKESSTLASEIDTVKSSVSFTLSNNLEKLSLTGSAAVNATGNTLNNTLTGNNAANILDGGTGNDTLQGGAGNDSYLVNSSLDRIIETGTLASEIDNVKSSASFTLSANVENLTLTGTSNLNATGNSSSNTLTGNTAANILNGLTGNDTLIGSTGNDTYIIDSSLDRITEVGTLASEIDVVKSSASFTLSNNLETLLLTGTSAINATGNSLNNTLTGNNAANILDGSAGNDILTGGLGNDTYVVNTSGDVVKETSTITSELDTVKSAISYTVGNNLENLALTGTASIKGVGNALNNTIAGNSGNNQLEGGLGNDVLMAGNGEDILVGGDGTDTFVITSTFGKDKISDFVSGIEDIKFSAAGIVVGDGDAVLEGKLARSASGGFGADNELVIFTKNIAGSITNINAASAIGSATEKLAIGYNKLFVVDNGMETNIYLFTSADNNASVSSSELKLLVTMYDVNNSTVWDYFLQA